MADLFDRDRYNLFANSIPKSLILELQKYDITIGEANIALDHAKKMINSKRSNPKISTLDFSNTFKRD
ncbi:hypothetical protein [Orenia marismortui]|uniref:Uncharacterized protein n=1 Tax=Orenia marismortui TaxID=46469 RepID=A0A4R8GZJ3_9FIRM|nr:hypothetical protein [Orenia marismortui]TDX52177.1 hypothetical protein C7959_10899 [Orenia marismortui]